jgi:putative Mg2+ transporter-C (MgtC) family protein
METAFITNTDIVIRLLLGFCVGAAIGLERASRHQTAGLKTHILISIGAVSLMLLSIWMPQHFSGSRGDPSRIAAQVVSGIGFLGAGAMLKLGSTIKGLTTAASLWMTAAIGLLMGAGMYLAASVALALALFTLIVIRLFERKFFPAERTKVLVLTYNSHIAASDESLAVLKSFGIRIHTVDVDESEETNARLHLLINIPSHVDVSKLAAALKTGGNVINFELRENY